VDIRIQLSLKFFAHNTFYIPFHALFTLRKLRKAHLIETKFLDVILKLLKPVLCCDDISYWRLLLTVY